MLLRGDWRNGRGDGRGITVRVLSGPSDIQANNLTRCRGDIIYTLCYLCIKCSLILTTYNNVQLYYSIKFSTYFVLLYCSLILSLYILTYIFIMQNK